MILNNVKISPIKGLSSLNITSSFGNRTFFNGKTGKKVTNFHSGIDLTGGTIVVATSSGTITSVRTSIKGYDEYGKFWKKICGWVKSASTWAMKVLKTVCEFTSITFKESNNLIPSTEVSGSYLGYTIKFGTFSTISTKKQ